MTGTVLFWISPQGTSTQGQATDPVWHGQFWISGFVTAFERSPLCRRTESCELSPGLGFAGADAIASPSLTPVLCLWGKYCPELLG